MSEEQAVSYVFTWETVNDKRVCPVCSALNGKRWENRDIFALILEGDSGPVWDLDRDLPLTHPNCRCHLHVEVTIDLDKIPVYVEVSQNLHKFDC